MPHATHRRAPLAPLLAVLVGATLVAACGGSATPSPTAEPTPTATAGPTPVDSGSVGTLDIPLPDGWEEIEMTEEALEAEALALQASNPELAASLQQLLDSGSFSSIAFFAVGYDGAEPIGNVNALILPMPGITIDTMAPLIESQFEQLGAGDIEVSDRTVLGTDGLQVDYELAVSAGGETPTLTGRVYLAIIDGKLYDVTVTCSEPDPAPCLADGDAMADGMTIAD